MLRLSRCRAHFLMPGSYTISAYAFQLRGHYNPIQDLESVIRFNICETGTKMAKYNDHKNIGVVLVNFPWNDEVELVLTMGQEHGELKSFRNPITA